MVKRQREEPIPVVDLFAGPGGLGEGFAAFQAGGRRHFDIRLSIEKDRAAHESLELRAFFRQFPPGKAPADYYRLLRGEITRESLFSRHGGQAAAARHQALWGELGSEDLPPKAVDRRIREAVGDARHWVLIGGPPCQAYSTAGRSRNRGKKGYLAENDHRHFLYKEYLRIIADHWPSVFVMENVKGMLSSTVKGSRIFHEILDDLRNPARATDSGTTQSGYFVYSLVKAPDYDIFGPDNTPEDYIIECEKFGIPQARHRVILLGIRNDLIGCQGPHHPPFEVLTPCPKVPTSRVLTGLPRLRSGLSKGMDGPEEWRNAVLSVLDQPWLSEVGKKNGTAVLRLMRRTVQALRLPTRDRGNEFIAHRTTIGFEPDWFLDKRIGGVCNYASREHIREDLYRYLYAACFAQVHKVSPRLRDFPEALYPKHKNVKSALTHGNFCDRFRVQLKSEPATTVVSHIAKDGHYYIHYDPSQCRSLTVREAARLQTFPDNYFFCGNRTKQYEQVGNAVPPLLARKIADIVFSIVEKTRRSEEQPHGRQAIA